MTTPINHNTFYIIITLYVWSLFTIPVQGQKFHLFFNNVNQSNGLINNEYNTFISQDSKGYTWIGSTTGLNRLNGTQVKQYQYTTENPHSLSENLIQSRTFEDMNGDLWVSTYNHLVKYVRKNDHFKLIPLVYNGVEIEGDHHVFFYEKSTKSLWVKISNKIYIYNIETAQVKVLPFSVQSRFFTVDTTSMGKVERIYGWLWMTPGFELLSKNKIGTFSKTFYAHEKDNLPSLNVNQIVSQNDSISWLFSKGKLIKFNRLDPKIGIPMRGLPNDIYNGLMYSSNKMIITSNSGLFLYDLINKRIIDSWQHHADDPNSIITNNLKELFLDKKNILFINTSESGVIYAHLSPKKFYSPSPLPPPNISFSSIINFRDQLWCIAPQKGIYIFDHNKTLIRHISLESLKKSDITLKKKSRFYHKNNEKLYFIPLEKLYEFSESTNSFQPVELMDTVMVNNFCIISPNSALINTYTDNGIKRLDMAQPNTKLKKITALPKSIFHNGLLITHDDNKLICSSNNEFINIYTINKLDSFHLETSLNLNAFVFCTWQDTLTNLVWLGTDIGLFQLDLKQPKLTRITPIEEHLSVHTITGDPYGRIWYAGNEGIGCYSPITKRTNRYRAEDGFPSNSFNINTGSTDSKGNIWFGSNKGITYFDPYLIQPYPYSPKVNIEKIKINNKLFQPDTIYHEKKVFKLKSSQNTLQIKLEARGFHLHHLVKIYYRLRGNTDEWQLYNKESQILYPGLSPQKYRLEWKNINANGIESPIEGVDILIAPRFTQTGLFYLLLIIGIIGIIIGTTRIYYRQQIISQKHLIEKQKMIQDERNRIGDELHDDLGSGLSLIRVLSKTIEGKFTDSKLNKRAGQISETSDSLLQNMNDILWAIDTKNNSLNNLIHHTKDYVTSYLPMNGLQFKFSGKKIENDIELHGSKRRNSFLIIKEVLHNIVKHAEAKLVIIKLHVEADSLFITIHDDGIGIEKEKMRVAGKGLKSIKKRAKDINGDLTIKSERGIGTSIFVEIPLVTLKE